MMLFRERILFWGRGRWVAVAVLSEARCLLWKYRILCLLRACRAAPRRAAPRHAGCLPGNTWLFRSPRRTRKERGSGELFKVSPARPQNSSERLAEGGGRLPTFKITLINQTQGFEECNMQFSGLPV